MALPPLQAPSFLPLRLWNPARDRTANAFDAAASTQRTADTASSGQPQLPEWLTTPTTQSTTAPSLLPTSAPQQPQPDDELPDWAPLLLGPLQSPAPESPVPPARTDHGRIDYEVQPGDILACIMSDRHVTEADLEWVNDRPFPPSGDSDLIYPGETIVVLDAERNAMARAQREALADGEDPRQFIVQEMTYATSQSPVPGDALEELKAELKARRPNDAAWAEAVDDAGESAEQLWESQGRTHAVFDPLYSNISEPLPHIASLSFSDEVHNQFVALATTTPTREAIENHRDMLLAYGPQDNVMWQNLVRQEAKEFLETGPQRAAGEVREAYETEQTDLSDPTGAYLAAEKLAELTDPEKVDPLTAALILEAAGPTISNITSDFVNPGIQLTHDQPDSGVTGEYGAIYRNLSAAADSAARSPLGQESVESMAFTLQAHGAPYVNARTSAAEGEGTALSLAIAYELRMNGDDENADRIETEVLDGVSYLKDQVRDSVIELGTTAMPFIDPQSNWAGFLPDSDSADSSPFRTAEETQEQRIDDQPEIVDDVESDLERINREGYQLTRAMTNLADYASQQQGSPNEEALLREAGPPDPADEPELSLALAVSTSGMTEVARLFNQDSIESGAVADPTTIVPDWSWPSRMVRNHIQADVRAVTGTRPFGIGLSLYGTGTYIWGISNKSTRFGGNIDQPGYLGEQGWRDLGFLGLYGSGALIEGTQVISRAMILRMGLDGTESGLRGIIGRIGNDTGGWSKLFRNHLSWFGWFNAAGTANYISQGDWLRASALGVAAGGTFISSYPALQRLLHLGKGGGPVGTAMTLIGSSALALIDMHEKVEQGNATAGDGRAYLIAAGVDPDIAAALERDDGDVLSVAGRLSALAEYRGTTPQEVLRFLNEQEPREVFDMAYAAQYVEPEDDGSYPSGEPANQWRDETPGGWDDKAMIRPLNIAELNEWVDHFMPGFPSG